MPMPSAHRFDSDVATAINTRDGDFSSGLIVFLSAVRAFQRAVLI